MGAAISRHVLKELERLQKNMTDTKNSVSTKDKEQLKDVKALLKIKEKTEHTINTVDEVTLELDQLEETIKLF